jgi:hypothetical protein
MRCGDITVAGTGAVAGIALLTLSLGASQTARAQDTRAAAPPQIQTLRQCSDQWQRYKSKNNIEHPGAYQEFMNRCFRSASSSTSDQNDSSQNDPTQTGSIQKDKDQGRAHLEQVSVSCPGSSTFETTVDAQVPDGRRALFTNPDRVQALLNYLRAYGRSHCEAELKAAHISNTDSETLLHVVLLLPNGQRRVDLGVLTARAVGDEPWQIINEIAQSLERLEGRTRGSARTERSGEH